jgi:hypothetical protein
MKYNNTAMYKRLIYRSALLLVLVMSCSCNKYLTLYPQDGVTRQQYWQSKEQIQAAVIGIYASLLADPAGKDRQLAEYLFLWGELRADNVVPVTAYVSNDELAIANDNILPTNSVVQWSAVYRTINLCNTLLDYAPNVLSIDNTLTQAKLNSYIAEALTIRSLMYFYLVRSFGDVPLKLKSTASDADIVQIAKSKQADVLAQIVKDLNTAEPNAVYTYGDRASDKGRVTRYTINALQADVYLWMEDYNNSITACDKIINSGQFALVPGDGGFYTNLYYTGNSIESIFEFQFDNQALNSFYTMFQQKPRFAASGNVMDVVYTADPYDPSNFDRRGQFVAVNPNTNVIYKYIGISGDKAVRTVDQSFAHWIVYRYADVLLMKAEAMAYVNRGPESLAIIQQIRTRANALFATQESPDPNDPTAVAQYVLDERDREFAFEGKRWYDLLRFAKRNNYAQIGTLIQASILNIAGNLQQSASVKLRDINSLYFPIYNNEILNDPSLIQNPFYK